jgi:glycosyltransferase involved in cell wall biosynthesis
MRIAIDLQACQQADTALTRDSLSAVRHMAGNPGGHTFWIALNHQFPHRLDSLRAAFAGLLPAERILAYQVPTSDGTARTRRMIDLIRENFFANLGADLVFTPGLSGSAAGAQAGNALSPHFLSAIGVAAKAGLPASCPDGTLVVEMGADPASVAQQAVRTFELAFSGKPHPALPVTRPALAWIAARAPGRTDAHARLIEALADRYVVSLVLPAPQVSGDGLACAIRSIDWFEQNAGRFERIVYTIGNSPNHRFMLALLARHPGVVFLQDFFLGALVDHTGQAQAFHHALFHSHGFTGLADALAIGRTAAANKYPLNKIVLDLATGVMVESAALLTLAQEWYGRGGADRWRCISLAQEPHPGAADCANAIEAFTQCSPAAHYRSLVRALRSIGSPRDARHPPLLATARSIAANQPAVAPHQLLVDVSAMVQLDAKTGISRVVRSILLALIGAPPPGYRIEAVYGDGGNRPYRYARTFTLALIGADDIELEDAPIEQRPGDIFVGVDVAASITTQNAALLSDMRNHGVQVFFVVHDILPVLMPNMFAYGTDTYFRKYLETITRHADGLLCTTRAGADTLSQWILAQPVARPGPVHIGHFHLGADLGASAPSTGLPANADQIFVAAAQRPTLLMVGTLEPRKAQAQALAALELLWSERIGVNLVIVGKPGWMVEPLIRKLKAHPQLNTQLFWLSEASDEMLATLYGGCSALLAPSLGEGFGLPLIEAAQYGLPIIARKLPVFQEICGGHAFYFEGEAPRELAAALRDWLDLFAAGQAPSSGALPWLSWSESARRMLDCVIDQHWDHSCLARPSAYNNACPEINR